MISQSYSARSHGVRRLALAAAGVVAFGSLAACSPESITEQVIEAGTDGNVDIDVDDEGGQVTIEGEGGTTTIGGSDELPDGFPTDAVPVAKGTISFTQSMTNEDGAAFTVLIEASGEPAAVWDSVKDDLTGAGLDMDGETTVTSGGDSYYSAEFTSSQWRVNATVATADDGALVTYVVLQATT